MERKSHTNCVISLCKNTEHNTKLNSKKLSFFRVRRDWLGSLGVPRLHQLTDQQLKHVRICGEHFETNCFLNPTLRNRLTHNATPLKLLPGSTQSAACTLDDSGIGASMDLDDPEPPESGPSETATTITIDLNPPEPPDAPPSVSAMDLDSPEPGPSHPANDMDSMETPPIFFTEEFFTEEIEQTPKTSTASTSTPGVNGDAKRKRKGLPDVPKVPREKRQDPTVKKLHFALVQTRQRAKRLQKECQDKANEIKHLKRTQEESVLASFQEKLSPSFFKLLQANLRNAGRNKHGYRYERGEKSVFLGINKHGPSGYNSLPMIKPSPSTISRILKKLKFRPGLNYTLMEAMKVRISCMPEEHQDVTVIYDEMSLRVHFMYDSTTDSVIGLVDLGNGERNILPAEEVLVCMIRSIYGGWKQPFCFWFTHRTLTGVDFRNLFQESLCAIQATGLKVRATVTDGLSKNKTALQLLGSSFEEPWFHLQEQQIYTIFDVPHLLKSLRNALLNYDLIIPKPDGTQDLVTVKWIKMFIESDMQMQPRIAKKVTLSHLTLNSFEKMRVAPAAQLLSQSVALGVITYTFLGVFPAEAMATGRFCERINKFFDSLNGVLEQESESLKVTVTPSSPHLQLWTDMFNEMLNWNFPGSRNLTFPSNWCITLRALAYLWEDLQEAGRTHMPVGNMNGDPIENFNSRSRCAGGSRKNPSARDYPSAFATCLIKDLTEVKIKKKNCQDDGAKTFIHLDTLLELAEKEVDPTPEVHLIPTTRSASTEEGEEEEGGEEEGEEEEEEDEVEEVTEVPLTSDQDFLRRLQEKLGATIGAHTAAPIVAAYMEKWKCEECSSILQCPAEFPLHLLSTLASTSSSCNSKVPSSVIIQLTRHIYTAAQTKLPPILNVSPILSTFIEEIQHDPPVRKFELCSVHADLKKIILKAIARRALEDILLVMNQAYKEKKKRSKKGKKSEKLQNVSHL